MGPPGMGGPPRGPIGVPPRGPGGPPGPMFPPRHRFDGPRPGGPPRGPDSWGPPGGGPPGPPGDAPWKNGGNLEYLPLCITLFGAKRQNEIYTMIYV